MNADIRIYRKGLRILPIIQCMYVYRYCPEYKNGVRVLPIYGTVHAYAYCLQYSTGMRVLPRVQKRCRHTAECAKMIWSKRTAYSTAQVCAHALYRGVAVGGA